jgi:hypothetical protein
MFGWLFKAACPVEPAEHAWLHARMRWLVGEFGLDRARHGSVILPTPEFFPEPYDATPRAGRVLFNRVAHYMNVNPKGIEVVFYEQSRLPPDGEMHHDAAGLYEGSTLGTRIQLEQDALQDPLVLVATATHELAHVLLLGQGRLNGDEPDHEMVTDLLTIYLGLGIFTANSRIRSAAGQDGWMEKWSIRRLGYLSQPLTGYALALYARLRQEDNPAWCRHLCADVYSPFRKGLRWLKEQGDGVLDQDTGTPVMLSDDELPPGFRSHR